MHSLQKQFHDFIQSKELIAEGDKILVAVSGGLDSMVLANLFLQGEFKFAIAHCNFGLRGAESDGDEDLVEDWCEKNTITLYRKRFELGEGSIQLNARNVRYEWFNELCAEHDYQKLAMAHHLGDSLETTLINLTRGTGPRGISGIRSKAEKTIRPLLFATKTQLKTYATENNLSWREDSSNSKEDYDRNTMRLSVIPKLEEMNPSLVSTFSDTSERLGMAAELVMEKTEAIKRDYLRRQGNSVQLDVSWVARSTDLLILSEILFDYGFNYATCKEIHGALGKSGKVFLSSNHELSVDRSSIFIKPVDDSVKIERTIEGYGDFDFETGSLSIESVQKSEVDFMRSESIVYLDADKVRFPMQLRTRKEGDKFQPLGMEGSKKVSDYLIDQKVPVAMKNDVLVLVSQNEIVWLVGYQISERAKISDNTKKVLKLSLT